MKKRRLLVLLTLAIAAISCTDNGKLSEKGLNEAGEDLQQKVQTGVDTIGSKLQDLVNNIDAEIDSAKGDTLRFK